MTTTTLPGCDANTNTHAKNVQAHKYCQIAAITLPKWLSEHLYSLLLFIFFLLNKKNYENKELNICCGAPNNSVSIVYVHVYLQNESIIVRETMNDRCYDREKHREKPTNQLNNKAHTYWATERQRAIKKTYTRVRYGIECASLLACWLIQAQPLYQSAFKLSLSVFFWKFTIMKFHFFSIVSLYFE